MGERSNDSAAQPTVDELLIRLDELQQELDTLYNEMTPVQRHAMLGMITGALAHEFNNVLTPILSYAQLALDQPDDEEIRVKALNHAASGSQRLAAIAESIMDFLRDPDHEGVSGALVDAAVDEALNCLGRDLGRDGIDVERRLQRGLTVALSPIALQQILLNLILNARAAMRPRGGRLTFHAERLPGPPPECSTWNGHTQWVQISVEDTGRGISQEQLRLIFAPFVSFTEDSQSPSDRILAGGTGLGLAICKRLAERARGFIRVHSEVGQGTHFAILVPEHTV